MPSKEQLKQERKFYDMARAHYEEQMLRLEVVIASLRQRNGALASMISENIDRFENPKETQGLLDRSLAGIDTGYNKVWVLVGHCIRHIDEVDEDTRYFAEKIADDVPNYLKLMKDHEERTRKAQETRKVNALAIPEPDPED